MAFCPEIFIFYVFAQLFIRSVAPKIRWPPDIYLNVSIYIVFCMKNRMFLTLFYSSRFQKNRMGNLYVLPKISETRAGCGLFSTHFLTLFSYKRPIKFECLCIIYWPFIEIYHFFDPFFDHFWPFLAKTSYSRHWHFLSLFLTFFDFFNVFWEKGTLTLFFLGLVDNLPGFIEKSVKNIKKVIKSVNVWSTRI